MKLGTHKWVRQERVRESQVEEQEQSHQTGLHSSSSGGMGQVKHVPQSRAGANIFKVSSWHPEVCYISQKLSDTAMSWNINKAQGKTRPAIMISKKLFLSLRCCTTRMILHTL